MCGRLAPESVQFEVGIACSPMAAVLNASLGYRGILAVDKAQPQFDSDFVQPVPTSVMI